MNASLPASYTKTLLDFYSMVPTLPCAYPFVIVTVFGQISRSHCHIYSGLTVFVLKPTPSSTTHQFVMTFFPDVFEQKTCHEVESTR